jgi:hypothetical protein
MSADVYLSIIDPDAGVVVERYWIGGNHVRDLVPEVLNRAPDHSERGYASWGTVTAVEAILISEAHYVDGISPAQVAQLAAARPDDRYWWAVDIGW